MVVKSTGLNELSPIALHLDHISHLEVYINSMEKLAVNFRSNGEQEVASAFNKFAEFSKELLTPMKNLVSKSPLLHSAESKKDKASMPSDKTEPLTA